MSQLAELRKIIVGEQADQLDSIKQRLEKVTLRSKDVAEVLPEAIRQAEKNRSHDLNRSLSPIVSSAVKTTIRRDTQEFADIFYPVLAPSVRLMVANMIRSFVQSMNQTIESATSVQGVKWRIESFRTGVPYTELALRRSLQYRVEQVFLIQPETGLLIEHLLNENVHGIDSDAVSAMLTAIQSFVTDSFDAKSDEHLTNMQVGELTVWMVHGPQALIACVIRGDAPSELRGQLIDILDQIHLKHSEELAAFDGTDNIIGLHDEMEPCLQLKLKDYDGGRSKISWVTIALLLALLSGLLYWLWLGFDRNRIRNESSKLLATTPGVLATDIFWNDNKLNVVGLVDPMAELPWQQLAAIGLERDRAVFEMKKFRSLEPVILSKRLKTRYALPDSLNLDLEQRNDLTVAKLSGVLPYADYRAVIDKTTNISSADVSFDTSQVRYQRNTMQQYIADQIGMSQGVSLTDNGTTVQVAGLPSLTWLRQVKAALGNDVSTIAVQDLENNLRQKILGTHIAFQHKAVLADGATLQLQQVAESIKQLVYITTLQQKAFQVMVVGITDGDSTADVNIKLRRVRAGFVQADLVSKGIDSQILKIVNNDELYDGAFRGVKFRIHYL